MITTARYASKQSRILAKKLTLLCGMYLSRGKKTIADLVFFSRKNGDTRIYIIKEKEGVPAQLESILITEVMEWNWEPTQMGIAYDH